MFINTKAQLLITSISVIADSAKLRFFFWVGTPVFPNPPLLGHQGIVTVIIPHLSKATRDLAPTMSRDRYRVAGAINIHHVSIVDQISSFDSPKRHIMSLYLGETNLFKYHSFGMDNIFRYHFHVIRLTSRDGVEKFGLVYGSHQSYHYATLT